jgi:hypothetical protein
MVTAGRDLTLPIRYKGGFLITGSLLFAIAAIGLIKSLLSGPKERMIPLPPGIIHPGSSESKPLPPSYALIDLITFNIAVVYKKMTL